MGKLYIKEQHLKMLIEIFDSFCPGVEVLAYGSRIDGTAHDGSDLDLAVKNFDTTKSFYKLKNLLTESNIPFLVDINIFETLPQSFQDEIMKNNIKIYG